MDKQTLTWLGCSSSLALLLVPAARVSANPSVLEIEFVSPAVLESPQVLDQFNERDAAEPKLTGLPSCTCGDLSPAQAAEAEGQLAIESLGCDCAGCRTIVRQLIADGQLLP